MNDKIQHSIPCSMAVDTTVSNKKKSRTISRRKKCSVSCHARRTKKTLMVLTMNGFLSSLALMGALLFVEGVDLHSQTLASSAAGLSLSKRGKHVLLSSEDGDSVDSDNEDHPFTLIPPPNCTVTTNDTDTAPSDGNTNQQLECFLWQLQVAIPPQSFSKDYFNVDIHDMVCSHFQIVDVQSKYRPSAAAATTTTTTAAESTAAATRSRSSFLHLQIGKLSATCHGRYHATGGLSGNVDAAVSQQQQRQHRQEEDEDLQIEALSLSSSAIQVAFEILPRATEQQSHELLSSGSSHHHHHQYYYRGHPKQPGSCKTKQCTTHLEVSYVKFSGSLSAKLIQLFAKMVSDYITDALQNHLCPLLETKLDPLVTNYIQKFNRWTDKNIQQSMSSAAYNHEDKMNVTATMTTSRRSRDGRLQNHDINEVVEYESSNRIPLQSQSRQHISTVSSSISPRRNPNSTSKKVPRYIQEYENIRWMLNVANGQLNDHLQRPWLPISIPTDDPQDVDDCKNIFRGISGWVYSIFGKSINMKLPHYFDNIEHTLVIEELNVKASVDIKIPRVSVEGLDTMDNVQIFSPTATLTPSIEETSIYTDGKNGSIVETNSTLKTLLRSEVGFFMTLPVSVTVNLTKTKEGSEDLSDIIGMPPTLKESFRVTVNVTNVDIAMSNILRVVGWDDTSLLDVVDAIQSFVDTRNIHDLAPIITTLKDFNISTWIASVLVDSIVISRKPKSQNAVLGDALSSSSLEHDIDQVVNNVLLLATEEYQMLWTELIRSIVNGRGRTALNKFIEDLIHRLHLKLFSGEDLHSIHEDPKQIQFLRSESFQQKSKLVNFTKFELLNRLNRFLEHSHTKRTINHFLRCVGHSLDRKTNETTGFVSATLASDHSEHIELNRITTNNWDSIDELQLIKPLNDLQLGSTLMIGTKRASGTAPSISFGATFDGPSVVGEVNVTFFGSLAASVVTQIVYDVNLLQNLSISHFVEQIACGLIPANEIRLTPDSTVKFGDALGFNISAIVNGKKVEFSTLSYPSVRESVMVITDWAVRSIRGFTNKFAYEWTELAFQQCPGIVPDRGNVPPPDDDNSSSSMPFWSKIDFWSPMVIALVLVQGGLIYVAKSMRPSNTPNHQSYEPPSANDDVEEELLSSNIDECMRPIDADVPLLSTYEDVMNPIDMMNPIWDSNEVLKDAHSQDHSILNDIYHEMKETDQNAVLERQFFQPLDPTEPSLFSNKMLPESVRFLIPILIVGTLALLVSSNISVGASVDLSLSFNAMLVEVPGLFQFSLANTASELYGAHVYFLLSVVVIFSGIWPYVKLFWILQVWLVPAKSPSEREKRLLMLDGLGKFSLVDSYVMILFIVAFRVHLYLNKKLGVNVRVIPKYGFFSFLVVTVLSLVLGHAVLFCHRLSRNQNGLAGGIYMRKESILRHEHKGRSLSPMFRGTLFLGVLSTLTLLLVGFTQKSFTFEFGGLVGLLLGPEDRTNTYSVLSLGVAIPESLEGHGAIFLQGSYFFFTVLMPIVCLSSILLLITTPMKLISQRRLLVIVEIANAWSAIEVFLLSILAALFQIGTFSDFMVGHHCDLINDIATAVLSGGGDDDDDDSNEDGGEIVCFSVEASVQKNCWYLLLGVVMYSRLVSFLLRFSHAAVNERLEKTMQEDESLSRISPFCSRFDDTMVASSSSYIDSIGRIMFIGHLLVTDKEGAPVRADDDDDGGNDNGDTEIELEIDGIQEESDNVDLATSSLTPLEDPQNDDST